jgi:NTE family protein
MVPDNPLTAIVFAGGLGLGAYHGGAFEAFASRSLPLDWVTGSSAGAITAALVAGSPHADRLQNLRSYWRAASGSSQGPNISRHPFAWLSAINTRLFGQAGFFHPRLPILASHFGGLYDLGPTRERLARLIDFGRLNSGNPRITICATNVESGDAVLFGSVSARIEMDHILASCGFLPEFAPVQIAGRWLCDGGFSLNAPLDPVLETAGSLRLYIIDLFARDGKVPDGLEAAAEKRSDLRQPDFSAPSPCPGSPQASRQVAESRPRRRPLSPQLPPRRRGSRTRKILRSLGNGNGTALAGGASRHAACRGDDTDPKRCLQRSPRIDFTASGK